MIQETDIEAKVKQNIKWTPEHETILVEWADKAMSYRWLHSKSNAMYSSLNAWYTIPVIVISTLTGTANFAQERVPVDFQPYFAMIVGGFNILAGIITTVQQFLKITQLNESHRVSSIAWDKFYRNIKIEISKHPDERLHVEQMIKMCKEEFDRLMETSPIIPDKIIQQFKNNFSEIEKTNDGNESNKIITPEICDVLISTENYRNPWFSQENKEKAANEKFKNQLIKENEEKKISDMNDKMVADFKTVFYNLNGREALDGEIIDNLKDKMELNTLTFIIDKLKNDFPLRDIV
jgi:hypothetical protein